MIAGILGLGSIGGGAALSLLRAGHRVIGYDPSAAALAAFVAEGGEAAASPTALLAEADVIGVFVVNADQVETALFASGAVTAARPGTVVILSATIPPSRAVELGESLAVSGLHTIDAPVSGGAAKARSGALTVMASGADAAFDAAAPFFDAVAERVFRLGPETGAGSRMKMVNQHLAGIHIAAAAEAMTLAQGMGLDLHLVIEVIGDCAGTSWMFENRGPHIADGDYTPLSAIDIFVKDLGIVADEAQAVGLDPVLARTALSRFIAASEEGWGGQDDAAVAKLYAKEAGIVLPGNIQ